MGVQLLDIAVKMREVIVFSIRACYKIVSNHPFLVGLLCFLALLYSSFPFVFSLLVSVSPVLVCTAALLGTLLSFGHPDIPEAEKEEEKTVHDIVPLKTGVLPNNTVVERDESYSADRYTNKESIEEPSLGGVERGVSFGDDEALIENESREVELKNGMFLEEGREVCDGSLVLVHQYSPIPNMDDENLDFDDEKSADLDGQNLEFDKRSADSFDSKMVNIGSPIIDREILEHQFHYSPVPNIDDENLEFDNDKSVNSFDSKMLMVDYPPGLPLKQEEEEEEDVDDDDETSDSGSDGAESSSPDASMADIIPMLDELHPLVSHVDSDRSSKSSDSDQESDAAGHGRETVEGQEEEAKSAITWTEEDQKNLMDLGSSELERNQRLESLIARRRARKSGRTSVEKNLIDLESSDLPFDIAPISTSRRNPFDLLVDDYDIGLPQIPGSAPSVLLPRSNPFDIPYDSSEEKPDLMEDSFQQEFKTSHAKDPFFRRHESFNVRPSLFGPSKQAKHDIHLRPFFVSDLEDKNLIKEETEVKNFSDEDLKVDSLEIESEPQSQPEILVSREPSLGGADVDDVLGTSMDENPIYDHSPTPVKEISSSPIASAVQMEEGISPVLADKTVSPADMEPVEEVHEVDSKGLSSIGGQSMGESLIDMEVAGLHPELNGLLSEAYQCGSAEKSFPRSYEDQIEVQEPPVVLMESSDELQHDDHIDASIPHKFLMEAIDFDENVEYIVEDTDEMQEIDEGILSELDAVGDFSVKESVSSLNEFGSGINSSVSLSFLNNAGSVTPVFLEEDSIDVQEKMLAMQPENLNASLKEINPLEAQSQKDLESVETDVVDGLSQFPQEVQPIQNINFGLPLVEASSPKELESIYEQETKAVLGASHLNESSNTEEINLGMPLVEASSLKDLESLFDQAKLKCELLDPSHVDSEMPIPEAHDIQDVESPFKKINVKEDEEHDILDLSTHGDEKSSGKSESPKNVTLHEHSTLTDNEIQLEARSSEDTDLDHKQLHESDVERLILHDSVDGCVDTKELLHVGAHSHEYIMESVSAMKQELEENPDTKESLLVEAPSHALIPEREENPEKPIQLISQDGSVKGEQDIEVDSSEGISNVNACDATENSKGDTEKLDIEVNSKDYNLATSVEKADEEVLKGDSSS